MPSDPSRIEEALGKFTKPLCSPQAALALLLAILWAIPFLSFITFLACLYAQFSLLRQRKYAVVALSILAMPYTLWYVAGCYTYLAGTARIHGGPMNLGLVSLDPDLRCDRVANGCLIYGNEWMT